MHTDRENVHIVRSVCPNRKYLTKLLEKLFELLANTSFRPAKHANSSQNMQIVQSVCYSSYSLLTVWYSLVFLQTVCIQFAYCLHKFANYLTTWEPNKTIDFPKTVCKLYAYSLISFLGVCASLPRAIYAGGFHCICVTSVHYARGVPMGAYI